MLKFEVVAPRFWRDLYFRDLLGTHFAKFYKFAKFHKNLLQTHENVGPQNAWLILYGIGNKVRGFSKILQKRKHFVLKVAQKGLKMTMFRKIHLNKYKI